MNSYKLCLALIASLASSTSLFAQSRTYIIKFGDKPPTPSAESTLSKKSLERRAKFKIALNTEDLPVNKDYVAAISGIGGISMRYSLKWQNAVVVNATSHAIDSAKTLSFVKSTAYVGRSKPNYAPEKAQFVSPVVKLKESTMNTAQLTAVDYGASYFQNQQIEIDHLHHAGFDGAGVTVAVLDAGFNSIHKIPSFQKHQANGLLTFGYDIAGLDNELNIQDNHGTAVSSCIGGYDLGNYIGSAPKAHLVLFRTEFADTEYPIEELNWCKAAELADSIGVDMLTSSLGYNQYDDKALSYTHTDLDGKTSYISQAARTATQKGIIVLNSAGNSGNNKWRKIGTPADASEVLSVGAVNKVGRPGRFTSQGYNALGQVKPDISALGVLATVASPSGAYYQGNGTSYSTPIAAGGVACLIQAFPNIHPDTIKNAIRLTATKSIMPDSFVGYGIVQYYTAYRYLSQISQSDAKAEILSQSDTFINIYTANATELSYDLYRHKKLLWIFPSKKKVISSTITCCNRFLRINLRDSRIKCNEKFSLKVTLNSSGGTQTLSSTGKVGCTAE